MNISLVENSLSSHEILCSDIIRTERQKKKDEFFLIIIKKLGRIRNTKGNRNAIANTGPPYATVISYIKYYQKENILPINLHQDTLNFVWDCLENSGW